VRKPKEKINIWQAEADYIERNVSMVKVNENKANTNNIIKIIKGSLLSIAISIIALMIFAIFLTYTNVNENAIPTVIIIVTAISILIGSQITTSHIKKNGVINGILVGLIYVVLLYLLSSIVSRNFGVNNYSIIMIATSVAIGGLGGIIGVNRK